MNFYSIFFLLIINGYVSNINPENNQLRVVVVVVVLYYAIFLWSGLLFHQRAFTLKMGEKEKLGKEALGNQKIHSFANT